MIWNPIDTAPKDGTPVDLWVVERSGDRAKEYRVPACWYNQGRWQASDMWLGQAVESPAIVATHWMAIPAGPVGNRETGSYAWRPPISNPIGKKALRSTVTYTSSRSD